MLQGKYDLKKKNDIGEITDKAIEVGSNTQLL